MEKSSKTIEFTSLTPGILIGLICGLCIVGVIAMVQPHEFMSQYNFEKSIELLESGTLVEGSQVDSSVAPKPFSYTYKKALDGTVYALNVYKDKTRVLSIYTVDRKAFAAYLVEGVKRNRVVWYFANVVTFTKYLELNQQTG